MFPASLPDLNLTARDLNINLKDSCNCCCWSWHIRPNPHTQVYVTSDGEVIRFNRQLARDNESLKRCNDNLLKIIGEMASYRNQDLSEVRDALEQKVILIRPEDPHPVTLETIMKIKEIVDTVPPSPIKKSRDGSNSSDEL